MLTKGGEWSVWPLKGNVKVEFNSIYLTLSRKVHLSKSIPIQEYPIVTITAGCQSHLNNVIHFHC